MMCESAKSFRLRSWLDSLDVLINNTQSSGSYGRDGEWVEMEGSCDPIDLLPEDPFQMSQGSISTSIEELIGYNSDDYEMDVVVPLLENMEEMNSNDSQVSGGCGSDEDEVKMNSLCDPIDFLPIDPFEMNVVSEIDIGKKASGIIERGIACNTCACKVHASDLVLASRYDRGRPFLSSFEAAVEFNKLASSTRVIDVFADINSEAFGAKVEGSFSGRNFAEPFHGVTRHESLESLKNMVDDLISDGSFSESVLNASVNKNFGAFGAMGEASFSDIDFPETVLNVSEYENLWSFEDMVQDLLSDSGFSDEVLDVTGFESSESCEVAEDSLVSSRRYASYLDGDVNNLHEGLFLSLEYLGVRDLLSLERVCRSLRSAIQNDPLLWRNIHIGSFMGEKITDDDLYRLTQRAQGNLQRLILEQCPNITDKGLKRVVDNNPVLEKLNVPAYIKLNSEGLISNLKTIEFSGMAGLENLKLERHIIGSIGNLEELRSLFGAGEPLPAKTHDLLCSHDETSRSEGPDHCRVCCACAERCAECGRCIDNCAYKETFIMKNICLLCANSSSESQDILEDIGDDEDYKCFHILYQPAF